MSKVAFFSSFLAVFITMDVYLFNGSTTRAAWRQASYLARAANAQVARAVQPFTPGR